MTADQFLTASRVLIVAGKGGVGKSTVSRALATCAARAGSRVLLVLLDDSEPGTPRCEGLEILRTSPGRALADYLSTRGMGLVSRQLANSGLVELVASTAPGIDDLLVLGRIKQLANDRAHDLVVVDGPAAGHAMDMLRAPAELRRAVPGGPIAQQADEVSAMLADAAMCRVVLVTTPAMTPVHETVEAARALWSDSSASLAGVVVNMCDEAAPALDERELEPRLREAWRWMREREAGQRAARDLLATTLPLRQVRCARHRSEGVDLVSAVADDIARELELAPGTGVGP